MRFICSEKSCLLVVTVVISHMIHVEILIVCKVSNEYKNEKKEERRKKKEERRKKKE